MLRKLSQRLKGKRASDEFVSIDAKIVEQAETQRRLEAAARRSWEPADEDQFYTNSRLEALSLEPIIAPTPQRMTPTVAPREALLPPPPRPQMRIEMPPRAWLAPDNQPHDVVLLGAPGQQIATAPAAYTPDPFDAVRVEPIGAEGRPPRRPPLRRKAVSYRTQRDLPLRVQAVRRAHQEQLARRMAEVDPVFAPARRKSDPEQTELPTRAPAPSPYPELNRLRPQKPLPPSQNIRRTASEAHLGHPAITRTHSHSRVVARSGEQPRDYYIETAQMSWQLPSPTGRTP